MSQTRVDIRIRKPSTLFRFSKSADGIHFPNKFHFKRYKKPDLFVNLIWPTSMLSFWPSKQGGGLIIDKIVYFVERKWPR